MQRTRRSALTLAGAAAGVVAMATLAGAVNLGLLSDDDRPEPGAGVIDAVEVVDSGPPPSIDPEPRVDVVVQDVYDLPPSTSSPQSPAAQSPSTATPSATIPADTPSSTAAAGWDDDDRHDGEDDDDGYEDDHGDDDRDDDHDDDRYDDHDRDDDD